MRGSVSASRSAPSRASRSDSEPVVSSSVIAVSATAATGPVSRPASMRMIATPVRLSPRMIDHWIGAAPRSRGSSDACTFQGPSAGMASSDGGRIRP